MNNPELSGVVRLDDLPQKEIFVCLEKDFFDELNFKIREFGAYKLARKIQISKRILLHWLSDGSLIRLDCIIKILGYFNCSDWQNKIIFLRGRDGNRIYHPKLPFNFNNPSGVKLVASILGDGGLSNKGDIMYSNTNNFLIKDFISDLNNIFGKVEFYISKQNKKNSVIEIVYPPAFLRYIFNLLGIKKGKKVVNNPVVPYFIYGLPSEIIFEFISKMIDDEGSINIGRKHIAITSATEDNHLNSNLLLGIRRLLLRRGISSQIYSEKPYPSTRGRNRIIKRLQINGYDNLNGLYHNLNLKSKNKSKKLRDLIDSYSQMHYPTKRCKKIYLAKMEQIQLKKGFFTVEDLSKEVERKLRHVRNMVHKYYIKGSIKCIEPHYTGKPATYAKYRVIR